ncbi:MAG: ATP-binding protein [Burkholderiales bacterium]|nr:ATP-binding protein [Burkholderiales bacterium]
MGPRRIQVRNLGQIKHADVEFGDLTVLVGPQATGKSIFLQLLKLAVDTPAIQAELRRFNIEWDGNPEAFLDLYLGEGMAAVWKPETVVDVDGEVVACSAFAGSMRNRSKEERLFYIPAQRVMSLRDGQTRPFTDYRFGDPFSLREFSERLHVLVQNEFGRDPALFPKTNRLNKWLRDPVSRSIFMGGELRTSTVNMQKQVVLQPKDSARVLPYLVWSAGQREFFPLLLGLYWLMPSSRTTRRDKLDWVVIEEPEMGLHPDAISVVMSLVMELLSRGYRVCLSTHSPAVLDVVWVLRTIQECGGTARDVLNLFEFPNNAVTKRLADDVRTKDYKVYFFDRDGQVRNISGLDPGAEDEGESHWGGLTGFSSRAGDVVSHVVNRQSLKDEQ